MNFKYQQAKYIKLRQKLSLHRYRGARQLAFRFVASPITSQLGLSHVGPPQVIGQNCIADRGGTAHALVNKICALLRSSSLPLKLLIVMSGGTKRLLPLPDIFF